MSHPSCNHAKLEQIIFFEPYSKIGTWQSSSPYFPWVEPESSLLRSSHLSPTPNQFVAFILQNSGGAEAFISLDFTFYVETWQLRFLALSPKKRKKIFSLSWEETSDHGPKEIPEIVYRSHCAPLTRWNHLPLCLDFSFIPGSHLSCN